MTVVPKEVAELAKEVKKEIDINKPIGEAFDYRHKARQAYNRNAGVIKNVVSIKCEKDGKLVREIKFYPEGDRIIVEEYELKVGNKGDEYMGLVFSNNHKMHSYARSEFIGRVCCIGYELGNSTYDSEFLNTLFSK